MITKTSISIFKEKTIQKFLFVVFFRFWSIIANLNVREEKQQNNQTIKRPQNWSSHTQIWNWHIVCVRALKSVVVWHLSVRCTWSLRFQETNESSIWISTINPIPLWQCASHTRCHTSIVFDASIQIVQIPCLITRFEFSVCNSV